MKASKTNLESGLNSDLAMSYRAILWASKNDWFVAAFNNTVIVKDCQTGEQLGFNDFKKLVAWAGY